MNRFLNFWISRFIWLWRDQKGQLPGEEGAISHRWDLFKKSPELVESRFNEMRETAINGFGMAMSAIQALSNIGQQLGLINRVISIDTTPINMGNLDDRIPPSIDMDQFRVDIPAVPGEPTLIDATLESISSNYPEMVGPGEINTGDLSYASNLITALKAKILSDIQNGSTGIPDAIQTEMFNRNYERDLEEYNDEQDRIASEWGRGGFPFPNGGLRAAQGKATRAFTNKRLDLSREIMIKSWEISLQNSHFMIQQGIAIEGIMIQWTNQVATRVFEASKAVIDSQLRTFEARWKGFGEKAKIIIEKCKAKIEYNLGMIRMYEASVNAFGSKMRAESDRVNAVARGYEAQTSVFNTLVNFDVQKINLDLKIIQAKIEQAMGNASILIKDKEVELKNYELIKSLMVECQKAIGMVAAQVASGALSAVHASVGISASDSASYGYSTSATTTTTTT